MPRTVIGALHTVTRRASPRGKTLTLPSLSIAQASITALRLGVRSVAGGSDVGYGAPLWAHPLAAVIGDVPTGLDKVAVLAKTLKAPTSATAVVTYSVTVAPTNMRAAGTDTVSSLDNTCNVV